MRKKRGGDASFVMGLILGIVVGAAVAIILTPTSGQENRARLSQKMQETKHITGE